MATMKVRQTCVILCRQFSNFRRLCHPLWDWTRGFSSSVMRFYALPSNDAAPSSWGACGAWGAWILSIFQDSLVAHSASSVFSWISSAYFNRFFRLSCWLVVLNLLSLFMLFFWCLGHTAANIWGSLSPNNLRVHQASSLSTGQTKNMLDTLGGAVFCATPFFHYFLGLYYWLGKLVHIPLVALIWTPSLCSVGDWDTPHKTLRILGGAQP